MTQDALSVALATPSSRLSFLMHGNRGSAAAASRAPRFVVAPSAV
jgi:hypothetical protein